MSERVVDRLEVIDVDEQHREGQTRVEFGSFDSAR
jgi:hypothetical protein